MEHTNKELQLFDKLTSDLILEIFQSTDKRYVIYKIIKEAYDLGNSQNKNEIESYINNKNHIL